MPLRAEYRRDFSRAAAPEPPVSRVGVRRFEARDSQGVMRTVSIDPANFRCPVLAGELADELVELARDTRFGRAAAGNYARAIGQLCRYVDQHAPAADRASLARAEPDLHAVLTAWVQALAAAHRPGSRTPAVLALAVRTLIARRIEHPARPVAGLVPRWIEGAVGIRRGETAELDEFTRADKLALVRAAWSDLHAVEQRLARGRAMAAEGSDPRIGGWLDPANLLWALAGSEVSAAQIAENLPACSAWPTALLEVMPGRLHPATARWQLLRALLRMIYPHNIDLHCFRVLLMAGTGASSEEVTGLNTDDVEFQPRGALVDFTKGRARAHRRRSFASPEPGGVGTDAVLVPNRPRLDVSDLLRRLHEATGPIAARAGLDPAPLFVRASLAAGYKLQFGRFEGARCKCGFDDWVAEQGLKLSGRVDIRRLRKSTKVEKALTYRGRVSEIADDHSVEVFRGHYAHGTTLHVIAGGVVTGAQQRWLAKALEPGPLVLTAEALRPEAQPATSAAAGLSAKEIEQLRSGELDMGISSCRDPFSSPFGKQGAPCPVAPLRCLECRHALVLPSNLPQLLLFADHLERLRARLAPRHFHELWGQSSANLQAVLKARTEAELSLARRQIAEQEIELHLPLSARVEFDT
jgi:hypothetical protein